MYTHTHTQFDQEIRSRNIDPDSPTFRIITDGQLPLRQCLHPEACAKDIELPNYFCKFSDLRKEFCRFKSSDAWRSVVPMKDLPNMPPMPVQPTSIADMIAGNYTDLNIRFFKKKLVSTRPTICSGFAVRMAIKNSFRYFDFNHAVIFIEKKKQIDFISCDKKYECEQ